MKIIRYQLCTEINHGTEDEPKIEQVFSSVGLGWSPENEELAKKEAYNGDYTIVDDGEPEPTIPPTNEELAAENKLLKQQVSALTEQQSFYEDCIAEMASVVYA